MFTDDNNCVITTPFYIPTLNQQPQIWLLNHYTVSQQQRQLLAACLSTEEWQRNSRFRYVDQQHRDQICRGLIRTVLAAHLSIEPQQLQFFSNPQGKPQLLNPNTALQFNLSHSGEWIALAVADQCSKVGVDIEYCQRRNDVLSIADRYFSAMELTDLFAQAPSSQRKCFFDYWTLKEAYIKAQGQGLAIPLDKFSFHPHSQPIGFDCHPSLNDNPLRWQFFQNSPHQSYRLAIAIKDQPTLLKPVLIFPYANH